MKKEEENQPLNQEKSRIEVLSDFGDIQFVVEKDGRGNATFLTIIVPFREPIKVILKDVNAHNLLLYFLKILLRTDKSDELMLYGAFTADDVIDQLKIITRNSNQQCQVVIGRFNDLIPSSLITVGGGDTSKAMLKDILGRLDVENTGAGTYVLLWDLSFLLNNLPSEIGSQEERNVNMLKSEARYDGAVTMELRKKINTLPESERRQYRLNVRLLATNGVFFTGQTFMVGEMRRDFSGIDSIVLITIWVDLLSKIVSDDLVSVLNNRIQMINISDFFQLASSVNLLKHNPVLIQESLERVKEKFDQLFPDQTDLVK